MSQRNRSARRSRKRFSLRRANLEGPVFDNFDFCILCDPAVADKDVHPALFPCIPIHFVSDRQLDI